MVSYSFSILLLICIFVDDVFAGVVSVRGMSHRLLLLLLLLLLLQLLLWQVSTASSRWRGVFLRESARESRRTLQLPNFPAPDHSYDHDWWMLSVYFYSTNFCFLLASVTVSVFFVSCFRFSICATNTGAVEFSVFAYMLSFTTTMYNHVELLCRVLENFNLMWLSLFSTLLNL